MSTTAQKPATTSIPVQLSEPEFEAFILPHLSMPKRGPKGKLGSHRVFNLIIVRRESIIDISVTKIKPVFFAVNSIS